jgi:uncharacterized protein YecE (DUF72 family)
LADRVFPDLGAFLPLAIEPVAARPTGRLCVGTSGFAYRDWAPRFYPAGIRPSELLRAYGARLPAVELNNTFYRQPSPETVAGWLADTPTDFRFVVKAQRGGSLRAFGEAATQTVGWLTGPYRLFGERLGCVLFRVPNPMRRDDLKLRSLLDAWPVDLPLAVEFQHESWHVGEIYTELARYGAALCATDLDDELQPDLRRTGGLIYLRLRRTAYSAADINSWAARLAVFLADGTDCYVFFRHDADGESAIRALALGEAVAALGQGGGTI